MPQMTPVISEPLTENVCRDIECGYIHDGKRYPGSPTQWKISQGDFIFSASEKRKNIFVATWYAVFLNFCGGEAEGTSGEKTKQEE